MCSNRGFRGARLRTWQHVDAMMPAMEGAGGPSIDKLEKHLYIAEMEMQLQECLLRLRDPARTAVEELPAWGFRRRVRNALNTWQVITLIIDGMAQQ